MTAFLVGALLGLLAGAIAMSRARDPELLAALGRRGDLLRAAMHAFETHDGCTSPTDPARLAAAIRHELADEAGA